MSRMALPLVLVLAACGPKEAPVQSAAGGAVGLNIPDDHSSRQFAERLLSLQVLSWTPSAGGSVQFKYNTLTFLQQNTWQAEAMVSVLDDELPCRENGSWIMDPAQSDNTATVEMTVEKTSCSGHEVGTKFRVKATILQDGTYKFDLE